MDYNHVDMPKKSIYIIILLIILFTQTALTINKPVSAPGPYDLIAEVNAYRLSMGYYALNPDPLVMAAAQGHADWIVETGNGGHYGASGSDETMRVYWTGYGGGKAIKCDEAWASTNSVSSAVYGAWADWTHQQVMLNGWGNNYTDVGAGVADNGDGTYVFILDVCLIEGGSAPDTSTGSSGSTITDPNATPDLSNYIFGVMVATPAPDGSIVHIVQYGQTLASISEAYGLTINELRAMNGMAVDSTNIWPDQKLLIKKAVAGSSTGTPAIETGTPTATTATTVPTYTPRARTSTPLPTLAITGEAEPAGQSAENIAVAAQPASKTIGMVLIILCGLGLIALVYSFLKK